MIAETNASTVKGANPAPSGGSSSSCHSTSNACSKQQSKRQPERQGNPRLQNEFLPAALAIQERPPSPTGRLLLWLLLLLFTLGLLWSMLGKVDIVVTAHGRIVPSGYVKVVQAHEAAIVNTIHVSEGDRVIAGQPLFTLDTTYAKADDARVGSQLAHAKMERQWRMLFESWLASYPTTNDHARGSKRGNIEAEGPISTHFEQHREEILARVQRLSRERQATLTNGIALQHEQKRSQATLAILTERVEAYRALVEREFGAKVQYLELLQQQTELAQTIPVVQARQQQTAESAEAIDAQILSILTEAKRENSMAITQLNSRIDGLQQESLKAAQTERLLHITAPVAGTVQELALHTEGAVVTAAQTLLKIVPIGAPVEVEARLLNKDIGFVHEGQKAEVKIDAFNFTKYGLLEASIVTISDDAVKDEQLGWVFKTRMALKRRTIAVDGKDVPLSPGMAITSEVKTGERRLIEFVLSPLLRYRQSSLRER